MLNVVAAALLFSSGSAAAEDKAAQAKSVYDFTVKDIDGADVPLSKYKGKAVLIINVASL